MSAYYPHRFDVVVVGSGHAGIEAALASARIGVRTLIITQNLDTIGQMSCNPAIGGPAKSHLACEIDALGGAMAFNADATGLQFRKLNQSKGPAVWATRIQCDKRAYQGRMKALLEQTENLEILQASVRSLLVDGDSIRGVDTDLGVDVEAKSVVITAGTFLRALLHVGAETQSGGRMGDAVSNLSESIKSLGFRVSRFKTGTPCRINSRSVDFSGLERQDGDNEPPRLSGAGWDADRPLKVGNFKNGMFHVEQIPCWMTSTTARTGEIIRENLHLSPLYSGKIKGVGPRYCPSIEDKIVRFGERETHHIFLEPEGRVSNEMYVNGVSTSLPFEVQIKFVRSIKGLENAEIIRPGYAVEYDFFPPTQLFPTLETKLVKGLFFAGQVNGTSGYEEAAAQGLVAGTNSALRSLGNYSISITSQDSYVGVMLEDLTARGTDEPYRMFTSRASNRLRFRQDNAEQRLTPIGIKVGLIGAAQRQAFEKQAIELARLRRLAEGTSMDGRTIARAMRSPTFDLRALPREIFESATVARWESILFDFRYEGYIARERGLPPRDRSIPVTIDFNVIPSLRAETRQKLSSLRPTSMSQARRLPGLTEADLSILDIWLAKNNIAP